MSDPLSNPYAPPSSEERPAQTMQTVEVGLSSYVDERRSVGLMVLLCVVTLGIYPMVWYIRRAPFLDSLDADRKMTWLPWLPVAMLAPQIAVAAANVPEPASRVLQVASSILSLVLAFRVRAILRSDFARTGRSIALPGVGVFFFGCLYLQHAMNEAADVPPRRRRNAG